MDQAGRPPRRWRRNPPELISCRDLDHHSSHQRRGVVRSRHIERLAVLAERERLLGHRNIAENQLRFNEIFVRRNPVGGRISGRIAQQLPCDGRIHGLQRMFVAVSPHLFLEFVPRRDREKRILDPEEPGVDQEETRGYRSRGQIARRDHPTHADVEEGFGGEAGEVRRSCSIQDLQAFADGCRCRFGLPLLRDDRFSPRSFLGQAAQPLIL